MKYLNRIFAWMGNDGMMHVILSALIASVLSLVIPWWVAGLFTLVIGVGKEIYDKVSGKGCAEWKDLAADVVGILIGIL
jgi:type IV secretory pathway TrbD component